MSHVQHRRSQAKSWVARYRTPDGRERSKSFERKMDADQYLAQIEVDKVSGDWVDPRLGRRTLESWWDEWWPTITSLRETSRARDESNYQNHVKPVFGSMPLHGIDHRLIQPWIAELSDGLAPATVQKVHQILSKTLRSAIDAGLIKTNPCDKTDLPRVETTEMRIITPEEVHHLADTIDERYRPLVYLGAYGGLRAGEMLGLRRKRIDTPGRLVHVEENLVEVKGRLSFNPPKTRAGRRAVSVPKFVVEMLEDHADRTGSIGPDDLVLTSPDGEPMRLGLFRQRFWYPATEKAGLASFRIHDLRHTAVSFWIATGASPIEVKTRAGHTSVTTVFDRYGHLLPGESDKVTDALERMATGAAP